MTEKAHSASASPSDDGARQPPTCATDLYAARKRAADLQAALSEAEYRIGRFERREAEAEVALCRAYRDGWLAGRESMNSAETRERVGGMDTTAKVERIAIACHEANRAYSLATGEDPASVFPGWREAPESIRESARIGVRAALEGATPEQLHESWLATKAADGWVWGPVKNLERKRHPCCVSYAELPAAQRAKDGMFAAIVHGLAALEG